jgi:methionyl aminopeptidase
MPNASYNAREGLIRVQMRKRRRKRRSVGLLCVQETRRIADLAAKKKKAAAAVQSEPPRVGLSKIFRNGNYPLGQEVEYTGE